MGINMLKSTDHIINKLIFPIPRTKMYGGQIMVDSIATAINNLTDILNNPNLNTKNNLVSANIGNFSLISFTTQFMSAVDTGKTPKYNVCCNGGGNNIKYMEVKCEEDMSNEYDGLNTHNYIYSKTDCIFDKEEYSNYEYKYIVKNVINNPFIAYDKHSWNCLCKCKGISEEQAKNDYRILQRLFDHFMELADIKCAIDNDSVFIKIGINNTNFGIFDNVYLLTYLSDMLLVQSACYFIRFPWYDVTSVSISSLKHSMSFFRSFEKMSIMRKFLIVIKCKSFNNGKADIRAEIFDKKDNIIGVIEQIVLLRTKINK